MKIENRYAKIPSISQLSHVVELEYPVFSDIT